MSEKKVSLFFNAPPTLNKYLPLIESLGENLCRFYGTGVSKNVTVPQSIKDKIITTKTTLRIRHFIIEPLLRFLKKPNYLGYWWNVKLLDYIYSRRIANDQSEVVFTSPLFSRTVLKCKKKGKKVILEAGNSEPEREYQRISEEYNKYHIFNKYIYGDSRFKTTCIRSFKLADKIICISKVSRQTYLDAGYPENKLELIPLTGTDFPVCEENVIVGREKAFITTAFHNFIKGTHNLLLAWQKAKIDNIPLIVVGRICDDLKEFIDKYGPFENVIFAGHQSNLIDWYSTRDAVGVLLSLSEGAGRVTPEMMSLGFPMITSPDATCDIVKDGHNGFVVDSKNIDLIATKMKWFADDWSRVHSMRKNVLESVSHRSVRDYSLDLAEYIRNNIE